MVMASLGGGQGTDQSQTLAEQVNVAFEKKQALRIVAGDSKLLQGRTVEGVSLNVIGHTGIVDYAPTELVITARAGTPLSAVEKQLAASDQMLPFEPPHLGGGATLGGAIACGLSGPRRPYAGAARDMVLGVSMINGRGEILNFGGQVMKNVAGYDVSRLMVGAQGTLGVLLDVSIKVLPRPACEVTLCLEMDDAQAIDSMNRWAAKPVPLSAACFLPNQEPGSHINSETQVKKGSLWVRLSGVDTAVNTAVKEIGGDIVDEGQQFWLDLKERSLAFFNQDEYRQEGALWRLSLPSATPPLPLLGASLVDWGGAQRWLISRESPESIHKVVSGIGGTATLYSSSGAFLPPLKPGLAKLHRCLKNAFDPNGILNPGRLYEGF